MIQEYLFYDDTYREAVEEYTPENVVVKIRTIENSECWIATYSSKGQNKKSAEILSDINSYVMENFHPTVLSNESSAYFNKILFPYINEFERKLRKLLYLKSALNRGDKFSENIKDLESKDLGQIFDLLFTDEKFIKNAKSKVNEKSWNFTKEEILSSLQQLSEDTAWINLIGIESVPALRENFSSAKGYRNDVMHAHNIDIKTFRKAKRLFGKINKQLDAEIERIITIDEMETVKEPSSYNAELNRIILDDQFSTIREVVIRPAYSPEEIIKLQELATEYTQMAEILKTVDQITPDVIANASRLAQIYQNIINI